MPERQGGRLRCMTAKRDSLRRLYRLLKYLERQHGDPFFARLATEVCQAERAMSAAIVRRRAKALEE